MIKLHKSKEFLVIPEFQKTKTIPQRNNDSKTKEVALQMSGGNLIM